MINRWGIKQSWNFIMFKAYADLKAESERTYVGFLWWVVEPVLYMLIFYLVFSVILNSRTDNFIAFLLIGLTVWRWFQSSIMSGSVSIAQSKGMINQVYFPKIVLPIVFVVSSGIKFLVVFALLIVFLWLVGYGPSISYLSVPVLVFVQFMFIVSLSLLMASLVPFLPDIRILLDNILRGVFFMSGIFFDIGQVGQPYQDYLLANPMASLILDYRNVLVYQQWPNWGQLLIVLSASLIVMFVAVLILHRFDRYYPRVVS